MNALILPGMSPRHKEWVRQVADVLRPHFGEVRFLDYAHWDAEGAEMGLEGEIWRAADLAKGLDDYVIIAKSIGTVLAALGNARSVLAPKRCVLMGFPLKVVNELPQAAEVAEALTQLPPTTFLHNENDPIGAAEAVREYLALNAPADYELLITPGDTHDYVDFDRISHSAARE